MTKGERISQFVSELQGIEPAEPGSTISDHPCYRGFFRCWNEQRYYEAHDVLEHLWLSTTSEDAAYFKGLIQAAGAFVHLQKQYLRPWHPKDARRLNPAARLFDLARENLAPFGPSRHRLSVSAFREMLAAFREKIVTSNYAINPWSPETAPKVFLANDPS